jgi:hypothetical protein
MPTGRKDRSVRFPGCAVPYDRAVMVASMAGWILPLSTPLRNTLAEDKLG